MDFLTFSSVHALRYILLSTTLFCFVTSVSAATPTNEELLELIKKQQQQIEQLMILVAKANQKIEDADEKIESTVDAIEDNMVVETANRNQTQVGGYGELHYNNSDSSSEIDFHRFVMFFGHQFSDSVRFFSELEVEHAYSGEGKPGEVELEQAYIEMDISEKTTLKAGVFLLPVGIINETHEPPTFYGVERNPVEKNIIPATWWEAGASMSSQFAEGLTVDLAIHSGLNVPTTGSNAFLIRSGRQKVAKADADSLAYTARVKYTAIPGLELAASLQLQEDITQGEFGINSTLFTAHAVYNKNRIGMRILYANWELDGVQAELLGRDKQSGYYLEPSYRLNDQWGLFARYNAWDNQAGNNVLSKNKQTNVGVNYWPHENVVFKLDLENLSGAVDGTAFNLGVGYQF